MILLRADSGTTIGSGHVVRCLSLAAAMRTLGETCVFVCADRSAETLIQKSGFRVICMNTNWRSWDAELPEFLALVQKLQPAWVMADSYSVTAHWMQAVRRQTKLAYLDDVNAFRYPVDVLVNYNIYASELDYEASYAGLDTKLLLGCGYTPLREEFCGLPARPVRRDVRDVLVSTGGADPNNLAAQLLKWAVQDANLHDIRFHFIVGALNPNLPKLSALA
ncbi:MAG: UDP-2,4-diacetamido-2,4,6-trideoxy-beta-L-altropyranose hydrolase, partial [Ruthenibacterium sp.]